jgi:hypothetical protein
VLVPTATLLPGRTGGSLELHVAWLLRLAELDASGQRALISREMQSWILPLQAISTSVWRR